MDRFSLELPVLYWGKLELGYEAALRTHFHKTGRFEFLCGRCWRVLGGSGVHYASGHGRLYGEDCWDVIVKRQYGLRYEWSDVGVRGRLCGEKELGEYECGVSGVKFKALGENVVRCGEGVRSCFECHWNGLWNRGGACGFELSFV